MDILKQYNIRIIFALDYAPFIDAFNKNVKNELYKYMAYHDTDSWANVFMK